MYQPVLNENEDFICNRHGYCYYCFCSDGTPLIFNLFTYPEYRQMGYAREMLLDVICKIRCLGCERVIEIEAIPHENNIDVESLTSFYTGLGLKIRT